MVNYAIKATVISQISHESIRVKELNPKSLQTPGFWANTANNGTVQISHILFYYPEHSIITMKILQNIPVYNTEWRIILAACKI